jgi:hypothetical protein
MSARAGVARLALVGLAGALLAATACRRQSGEGGKGSDPSGAGGERSAAAPVASLGTPPDHLAPGELVEGKERAFGIALPRGTEVTESFVDLVKATAPASLHAVASYLSARLEGGTLREGTESATFEHVKVRGQPEPELTVKITSVFAGSRLEIQKVWHPQQVRLLPDEEARWHQVGLTPQGRVVDPTHAE